MKKILIGCILMTLVLINARGGIIDSLSGVVGGVLQTASKAVDITNNITGNSSESAATASCSGEIHVSAEEQAFANSNKIICQMRNDYASNSLAAAKKWANKEVTLTLRFGNIINNSSIYCTTEGLENSATVTFPITDYNQASKLQSGQYIRVHGVLERPSDTLGSEYIRMKNVKIIG